MRGKQQLLQQPYLKIKITKMILHHMGKYPQTNELGQQFTNVMR
jgi:hypothetical protein